MSTAVPEIWFKSQRALRTIVQALIVLVPIVNGVGLAVTNYLETQTDVVVAPVVFAWLNGVVVATALIMGLIARIMAVPGVNAVLSNVGLGAVPKSRIAGGVALPDPKVSTRSEYQDALEYDEDDR